MNFFITNREVKPGKNGKDTIRTDGREHAGDNLRFGLFQDPEFILFDEPKTEADATYQDLLNKDKKSLKGSALFFRNLYDELIKPGVKKNDVLFFIHGFNTDLADVKNTFRTLQKQYVDPPTSNIKHIIVFTWPGRSPKIPYHYFDDKKDAIRSGEALARGMEKVIHFFKYFLVKGDHDPCNRKIHFMVHSMGHRVLKHMMLELSAKRIPYPDLFQEILLMAADIEFDIFEKEQPFDKLIELGKRVHVYFHHRDRVLDISKYTKNFSNRLGRYGRKKIDPTAIDVIDADVSQVEDDKGSGISDDALNHWYYYTSSAVINDIINVTNGEATRFKAKG